MTKQAVADEPLLPLENGTHTNEKESIWASILRDVKTSTKKAPATKSLVVLGDNESGRTTLVAKLQGNDEPKRGAGLEYHYIDVKDDDRDDTPKLGVWILDGDAACSVPLLKFALKSETLENTILVLVASMTQPWSILSTLQKWLTTVEEHLDRLQIDPTRLREMRDRLQYDFQHYTEPNESSNLLTSSTTIKSGTTGAGRVPNSSSSASLTSTIPSSPHHADEHVILPLSEGVLTKSLGMSILVVITKCDAMPILEKDNDYKDEQFDFMQHHLRKFCLEYGAALFYTSVKEKKNIDKLYKYIIHKCYGYPFTSPAVVVERDAIFIPTGWDNPKKANILLENLHRLKSTDNYSDVFIKPIARRPLQRDHEVILAEDDQEFLSRLQLTLNRATSPGRAEENATPVLSRTSGTGGGANAQTPSIAGRPRNPPNPAPGGSAAAATNEGALANFFNSLLTKKSGGAVTPTSAGTPVTQRSISQSPTTPSSKRLPQHPLTFAVTPPPGRTRTPTTHKGLPSALNMDSPPKLLSPVVEQQTKVGSASPISPIEAPAPGEDKTADKTLLQGREPLANGDQPGMASNNVESIKTDTSNAVVLPNGTHDVPTDLDRQTSSSDLSTSQSIAQERKSEAQESFLSQSLTGDASEKHERPVNDASFTIHSRPDSPLQSSALARPESQNEESSAVISNGEKLIDRSPSLDRTSPRPSRSPTFEKTEPLSNDEDNEKRTSPNVLERDTRKSTAGVASPNDNEEQQDDLKQPLDSDRRNSEINSSVPSQPSSPSKDETEHRDNKAIASPVNDVPSPAETHSELPSSLHEENNASLSHTDEVRSPESPTAPNVDTSERDQTLHSPTEKSEKNHSHNVMRSPTLESNTINQESNAESIALPHSDAQHERSRSPSPIIGEEQQQERQRSRSASPGNGGNQEHRQSWSDIAQQEKQSLLPSPSLEKKQEIDQPVSPTIQHDEQGSRSPLSSSHHARERTGSQSSNMEEELRHLTNLATAKHLEPSVPSTPVTEHAQQRSRSPSPTVNREQERDRPESPALQQKHEGSRPESPALQQKHEGSRPESPSAEQTLERSHSVSPATEQHKERSRSVSPATEHQRERSRPASPDAEQQKERSPSASPAAEHQQERSRSTSPAAKQQQERSHSASPDAEQQKERSRFVSPAAEHQQERSRSVSPAVQQHRERSRSVSPVDEQKQDRNRSISPPTEQRQDRSRSASPANEQNREKSRSVSPADGQKEERSRPESPATEQHQERSRSASPADEQKQERSRSVSPADEQNRERSRSISPTAEKNQERNRSTSPAREERQERSRPASPANEQNQPKRRSISPVTEQDRQQSRPISPADEKKQEGSRSESPSTEKNQVRSRSVSPSTKHRQEQSRSASPANEQGQQRSRPISSFTEQNRERSRSASPANGQKEERSRPESPATEKSQEQNRSVSPAAEQSRGRSRSASSADEPKQERSRSVSPDDGQNQQRSRSISPVTEQDRQRSRSVSPAAEHQQERSRPASPDAEQQKERSRSTSPAADQQRERSRSTSPAAEHQKERSRPVSPAVEQHQERSRSVSPVDGQKEERSRPESPTTEKNQERNRSISPAVEQHQERSRSVSPVDKQKQERSRSASPANEQKGERSRSISPVTEQDRQRSRSVSPADGQGQQRSRPESPTTGKSPESSRPISPVTEQNQKRSRSVSPHNEQKQERSRPVSPSVVQNQELNHPASLSREQTEERRHSLSSSAQLGEQRSRSPSPVNIQTKERSRSPSPAFGEEQKKTRSSLSLNDDQRKSSLTQSSENKSESARPTVPDDLQSVNEGILSPIINDQQREQINPLAPSINDNQRRSSSSQLDRNAATSHSPVSTSPVTNKADGQGQENVQTKNENHTSSLASPVSTHSIDNQSAHAIVSPGSDRIASSPIKKQDSISSTPVTDQVQSIYPHSSQRSSVDHSHHEQSIPSLARRASITRSHSQSTIARPNTLPFSPNNHDLDGLYMTDDYPDEDEILEDNEQHRKSAPSTVNVEYRRSSLFPEHQPISVDPHDVSKRLSIVEKSRTGGILETFSKDNDNTGIDSTTSKDS